MIESLPDGYRACIFGASGGIGRAFVNHLAADARCALVYAGSRRRVEIDDKVLPFDFDLADEPSIARAAEVIGGPLNLIIVATGILSAEGVVPEKSYRAQGGDAYAKLFAINATGPALIGKHFLPLLAKDTKSVFAALSARVGSISDNRLGGWHAYRASKAALNMIIANFARELAVRNKEAIALSLHPGTVATSLSAPFRPDHAQLFTPDYASASLLRQIDAATPGDSGSLIAWDGVKIPF